MPAYQYIYVMKGLGKSYPGGRQVLHDIFLCDMRFGACFYMDNAKIWQNRNNFRLFGILRTGKNINR